MLVLDAGDRVLDMGFERVEWRHEEKGGEWPVKSVSARNEHSFNTQCLSGLHFMGAVISHNYLWISSCQPIHQNQSLTSQSRPQ